MQTTNLRDVAGLLLRCAAVVGCCVACASTPVPLEPPSSTAGLDDPRDPALQQKLDRGRASRGAEHVPRTRHVSADGAPRFTNRLILESSPYLLQHAHNPVDWYPWGDEAFADAKRLGRPVFLSIGYSTCHWCHVMEEESFEDLEVAAYLNRNYIAIKVDREQRPDLDAIYMAAVQSMTGSGGWPMSTWLTPERQPFHGGTYFPARDGDRGRGIGFLTLLRQLSQAYADDPQRIADTARQMAVKIHQQLSGRSPGEPATTASLDEAARRYRADFDANHGGLRQARKFPSSLPIRFLLRESRRTGDAQLLEMARFTLRKMAYGGLHDQLGGGFHRYTVDPQWLVPHFEKMLYDNALLTLAYLEAFQATGEQEFAEVARTTLGYVSRELTAAEGGFYSATDADSLTPAGRREEGRFFTWTLEELAEVLGPQASARFAAVYGVTPRGNFEGRNVLVLPRPIEDVAVELGLEREALARDLGRWRTRLHAARSRRPAPLLDDKILASWNGLMISAFARGAFVLDSEELLQHATRGAEFILSKLLVDGRLRRTFADGRPQLNAYLDDYAFCIAGLLDLFEADGRPRWLEQARKLQAVLDAHYRDEQRGGYFMTSDDHESLLARERPVDDGAEPSGNAVALMNLLRLSELTADDSYRVGADRLLRAFGDDLSRDPTGRSEMLLALGFKLSPVREIVLVAPKDRPQALEPFLDLLRRTYLPGHVLLRLAEGGEVELLEALSPLARNRVARDGRPTAYVCTAGVCQFPTTDVAVFERQILASRDAEPAPEPD